MKDIKIIKKHLPITIWTRPKLNRIETKFLVIHYVGKKNHNANIVYNWFLTIGLKKGALGSASCNYCIDLNGDIYEFIPHNEISYTSGGLQYTDFAKKNFSLSNKIISPHHFTISVEVCHKENSGEFNNKQIESLKLLYRYLKEIYHNLDICRHYDITGKECPKFYIDNKKWEELKNKILN